ncbi:hypothetical protein M404DRAFT_1008890 [Pisolithus tinctorius Marx 270]|uniref:Uncharacterized protein n=1 Tax=Pisolithus tinctorius Marx 270 TaxID=870435 RepID=A0A0C3ND51_PISTI|nr:hypothetical protein M404DRAFT_1008890 [Pisolithus tinctorius Marx 270]
MTAGTEEMAIFATSQISTSMTNARCNLEPRLEGGLRWAMTVCRGNKGAVSDSVRGSAPVFSCMRNIPLSRAAISSLPL